MPRCACWLTGLVTPGCAPTAVALPGPRWWSRILASAGRSCWTALELAAGAVTPRRGTSLRGHGPSPWSRALLLGWLRPSLAPPRQWRSTRWLIPQFPSSSSLSAVLRPSCSPCWPYQDRGGGARCCRVPDLAASLDLAAEGLHPAPLPRLVPPGASRSAAVDPFCPLALSEHPPAPPFSRRSGCCASCLVRIGLGTVLEPLPPHPLALPALSLAALV